MLINIMMKLSQQNSLPSNNKLYDKIHYCILLLLITNDPFLATQMKHHFPSNHSKKKEKQHSIPDINKTINPAWCLHAGEAYAEHFVCKMDCRKLPPCNVCLNYVAREFVKSI